MATGKRERGMEGSNIQQISWIKSIDHAAERPRTGFKRVVQSIMLNYVWTDADLVAFMMLYIARQGFHTNRRLGSLMCHGMIKKKKKKKTGKKATGIILWPGTESIVSLLINAQKQADYWECLIMCRASDEERGIKQNKMRIAKVFPDKPDRFGRQNYQLI